MEKRKTSWFLIFVIFLIFGCKTTGSNYTQQSNIDPRRQVIYSSGGNQKGYLQQSLIDPRRTVQYNKKGKQKGYWQKSYVDPRKTVYYKKK